MILSIDFNPFIERKYILNQLNIGEDNKCSSFNINPAGKAFVASMLLDAFNENSSITGFLGGVNGDNYHKALLEMKIPHEFVSIKDETRGSIKIKVQEEYTNIMDGDLRISRDEAVSFYQLYSKLINKTNIVCMVSSSLPQGIPKNIYFDLIDLSKEKGKKFIYASGLDGINYALDAVPFMVILKKEELESLLKISLDFETEIIKASRYLLDRGIEYTVIDMGKRGTLMLGQQSAYRIDISNLNHIIDKYSLKNNYMAAGFALGIARGYDIETTMKLAQSFSIVGNIQDDIINVDASDIKKLMSFIEIDNINY